MKFELVINRAAEEAVQAVVHKESEFTARLENMVLQYNGQDKVAAYREDEIKMLAFSEMECISVLEGKTWAMDRNGEKYQLKYRLYELENILPQNFVRINKSTLANKDCIERLTASFNGSVDVVFKCGCREYVSRRCLAKMKRRLGAS